MPKLFIIAGPQSAGKVTLLNYLRKKHKNWFYVDEVNPASVTGKKYFGAINTTAELEKRIIEEDIKNIKNIRRDHNVIILNTGIFHYVFALYFNYKKLANYFFKQYLNAHKGLNPYVIFINAIPEVSWERRKPKYIKRIEDKGITDPAIIEQHLAKYKKIIDTVYPYWFECYNRVPYPKLIIENSNKKKNAFLKEADEIITKLTL